MGIVMSALLGLGVAATVFLAIVALVDLLRTGCWVRTVGWRNLLTAMRERQPRLVAALYSIYRRQLRPAQRTVVETYLDRDRDALALERLREEGRYNLVVAPGAWAWTETVAAPGEPAGNPRPE